MSHNSIRYFVFVFFVLMGSFLFSGCGKETLYLETKAQQREADPSDQTAQDMEAEGEPEEETDTCFVYICGAVKQPGVYELPAGSRVYEAIAMAGGLEKDAAVRSLNQAAQVSDGQMIEILTEEEEQEQTLETVAKEQGLVNINTATVAELMSLNGIGEAKAGSIVAYREEHGYFANIEELKNVSGIGEGVFQKIRDKITV